MQRRTISTAAAIAAALALPAAAQAHISLHPNTLPTGSNATVDVRVPNETDNARVVKVDMKVPPGFTFLDTEPIPGWTSKVIQTKLAKPITTDDGTVTQEASEVIWSANPGSGTPKGEFQNFPIAIVVPGNAGDVLTFKTIQTYSNGSVVRWIEGAGGEHPAPTVNVTAEGGFLQDQAGDAGPPAPGSTPAASTSTPKAATVKAGASKGLGIAALIVGALGLLIGLVAVSRGRKASA